MIAVAEQTTYNRAMSPTLFVIQIRNWDWPLHVGGDPRASGASGSGGNLLCSEAVVIDGIVLSPEEHQSKLVDLSLYPLSREVLFEGRREREVGRLYRDPVERSDLGFYASLFLPADTLQKVLICLSVKWQAVHLWVDDGAEADTVTDFGFSGDLKLQPPC